MIHRIVQLSLRQPFFVVILVAFIAAAGAVAFQKMPVDAYPDLSPPRAELITQWPGHAAEEVERLVTVPLEIAMNGVPHLETIRSISLYGLSDVRLTFAENTDDYFGREVVFQRIGDAQHGCFHIDESGFPKQGNDSVGVSRQYCGRLGKVKANRS